MAAKMPIVTEGHVARVNLLCQFSEFCPGSAGFPIGLDRLLQSGTIAAAFIKGVKDACAKLLCEKAAQPGLNADIDREPPELWAVSIPHTGFGVQQRRLRFGSSNAQPVRHPDRRVFGAKLILNQLLCEFINSGKK